MYIQKIRAWGLHTKMQDRVETSVHELNTPSLRQEIINCKTDLDNKVYSQILKPISWN